MYSSQSPCVEVDWSGINLNSIPFHSNTRGLRWIHIHPNKALGAQNPKCLCISHHKMFIVTILVSTPIVFATMIIFLRYVTVLPNEQHIY
jgi:hypothetical protein